MENADCGKPVRHLITGLPRSRTAWFAVLMSLAGAPTRHEVVRDCQSFDELKAKWPEGTGISDSCLALQLPRILREIKPRVLIVERDRAEVETALLKYLEGVPVRPAELSANLDAIEAQLEACQDHMLVCRIRYEALSDINAVKWAMRWLAPDCNLEIASDAMRLNVQVERRAFLAEIARPHNHWYTAP